MKKSLPWQRILNFSCFRFWDAFWMHAGSISKACGREHTEKRGLEKVRASTELQRSLTIASGSPGPQPGAPTIKNYRRKLEQVWQHLGPRSPFRNIETTFEIRSTIFKKHWSKFVDYLSRPWANGPANMYNIQSYVWS